MKILKSLLLIGCCSLFIASCNRQTADLPPAEPIISTPGETIKPSQLAESSAESQADMSQLVTEIVNHIDPADPDSLYLPEQLIKIGRVAVPTLLDLLESSDITSRWAAVYVLSRIGQEQDIPRLLIGLQDSNLSNRAGIAATLLWLGDDRGVKILEEALHSDQLMIFSHPPKRVTDYARSVLIAFNHPISSDGRHVVSLSWPMLSAARSGPQDITVSAKDCSIEITLNLQLLGAGATAGLANSWKTAILNMWDQQESSFCCQTDLTVNTKVGGAPDPNYTQITVIQVPPGGYHRPYILMGSAKNGSSNDMAGEWSSNTDGPTAAHEAGHTTHPAYRLKSLYR